MQSEITILISGIVLGLSGGITPGPLLGLVISQTLRYGQKEGMKIAIVPVITDFPIIGITLLLLSRLSNYQMVLGIISLLGGLFIFYLGYESIRFKEIDVDLKQTKPQSFRKGIVVNLLNPNLYLFWISVGAPTVLQTRNINLFAPILFVVSLYVFLIGSKCTIVILIEKSRHLLKSKYFMMMNKTLGILLWVLAVILIREGLGYLGVLAVGG